MPNVTMPRLSDSMVDGTIVSWLRADGDEISVGDEIVEIETDKAIMPYQAEHAGPLRIVARDGEVIAVGALIAHIGEPDPGDDAATAGPGGIESVASSAAQSGSGSAPPATTAAAAPTTATVSPTAPPASQRAESDPTHPTNGRVKASPVAKRLATALGVELAKLTGTGPGGRIVKRDVQDAAPAAAAPLSTGDMGAVERRPLTATQATIARRMVQAKAGAPDFTVTVTVDMEAAVELRAQLRDAGVEPLPSLGDFVIRACAGALREHPRVNASYAGDAIELHGRVNVGVAVAAGAGTSGGNQSLLVPTIHDADTASLGQIAAATRALAQRARDGQLTPAEMADATFTVSNLGMFGVSHFTAVLNPPQAAILAVGAAEQQVVVRDGQFVARHRMAMTLTADHRVIYGADAAAFLASVRERLENPLKLLI